MADGNVISRVNCAQAGLDFVEAPGQTISPIRIFDSNNNLIDQYPFGGGGANLAVILAPLTSLRNTIQPPADNVIPLTVQAHSVANTSPLFQAFTDPGQTTGCVIDADGNIKVTARANSGNPPFWGIVGNPGPSNCFFLTYSNTGVAGAGQFSLTQAGSLDWDIRTSTSLRTAALITPAWADPNDATRKSSLTFTTRDTVGFQTPLVLGAGGPGPTAGFLGAPDVPRQPTASTAGIAAIRTDTLANAVTDIRVILTALRAYGVTFGLTNNTA